MELVEFNLEQAGFAVVTAADGAEALNKARATPPSLIVLDLMLPDTDGFEICRKLKSEQGTAQIPIVMLTALSDEEHQRKGRECGAAEYITKPFDPDVLMAAIKDNAGGNGH